MKTRLLIAGAAVVGALCVLLAVVPRYSTEKDVRRARPDERDELEIIPKEAQATVYEESNYIDYTFTICNHGASTVKVERVIPGCGCTEANLDKTTLAPGQTARLAVRYDVRSYLGKLPRRDIRLVSDNKATPIVACAVSGNRLPRYRIDPRVVTFGDVTTGSSRETEVSVETLGPDMKLVPERMIVDSQWVTADVIDETINTTGSRILVRVRLDNSAPDGEIQASIFMPRVQDDGVGPIIQVNANVVGVVRAAPSKVLLGFCRPGQSITRQIRIVQLKERDSTVDASAGNAVHIGGSESVPPWIRIEADPQRQSEIRVIAVVPAAAKGGVIDEAIIVKYTIKGQVFHIRIPVSGMIIE